MMQIIGIGLTAFLLFLFQKIIYKRMWDHNLYTTISFGTPSIFEGQEGVLKEVIENRKRLPLPVVKVKFQTDRHLLFEDTKGSRTTDQYYRNDVFQIGGGEKLIRTIRFTGGRRGYYSIKTMDLVTSDLFMTDQFVATQSVNTSLYVYPSMFQSKEFQQTLMQLNGEVLTKRHLLEDPFEYRGIREYEPTDELKSINWKATAKTGEMKVNQKNYTALHAVRIFINTEDSGILKKEDAVESSLQIAAGLGAFFLKQGIRVSCYCNGIDCMNGLPVSVEASAAKGQMETMLRALARVATDKPVADFTQHFASRLLMEHNGTYTFFVSPNHYADFCSLIEQYHKTGSEYVWFYPVLEKEEPMIPEILKRNVKFIHIKGEK